MAARPVTIRGNRALRPAGAASRAVIGLWLLLILLCMVAGSARAQYAPLQCVPFARALSSISIYGDALHWWDSAAGRFERGQVPRVGSVLSFRPNLRMPLGHVAVVTGLLGKRLIEIDHANWSFPGMITRGVQAVDVSDNNDWTEVHVELLGRNNWFGGLYATNGFIYGRDLGPQIIDVAQALRATMATPYVVHVAEALQRNNHPELVDVAEYLRTHQVVAVPRLRTGAMVRLTSAGH